MAVVMTGYGGQVILSLLALPTFVDKYRTAIDGTQTLSAAWQTGLGKYTARQVVGALIIG
jgi:hypothetical protein